MEQIPVFESFGKRLEWWLDRRNVSRKDLMKFAGIAASTLAELIGGRSKEPSASAFLRMCELLELRPEYLLWGIGPPEAKSFTQLNGLEAQLVMLYRNLPDDAARDGMLIDLNHKYNHASNASAPTTANPYSGAKPPPLAAKSKPIKRSHTAKL